jgi:hypothetical protein
VPLLEEQETEWRSRELELESQRLIQPTSSRPENSSTQDRSGDPNQPTGTRETVGLEQNLNARRVPPIDTAILRQGLTRSPSTVSPQTLPQVGSPGSPQENPRMAKSRGWIRRLSTPVLSSLDGSKKPDSSVFNDSSQAWRSSLALPEIKTRHRKTSLDTPRSSSNQRR